MTKIPILLYYNFCCDKFKEQMDFLHYNGFAALSLGKITADKNVQAQKQPIDSRKKVALTFDGGDVENYEFVFPILKEKGFSATFFVTINDIGKNGKMDWDMIYDLVKHGMEVGSCGMSRIFATSYDNYAVLNDLLSSKQILEKYTRKSIDFLSVPLGFYNKRMLSIARDVGFKAICSWDAGYNDFSKGDLFLLKRFPVRRAYNLAAFKSIIYGSPSLFITLSEGLRLFFRRLFGYQVYNSFCRIGRKKTELE